MKPSYDKKADPKMMIMALKADKKPEEAEEPESALDEMLDMVMESEGQEKNKAIDTLISRLESLREEEDEV